MASHRVFTRYTFHDTGILWDMVVSGRLLRRWNGGAGVAEFVAWSLLPVVVFLPMVVGGMQWVWQRAGYFDCGAGAALSAITDSALLGAFVVWIIKVLRRVDMQRMQADADAGELHERYRHIFVSSPFAIGMTTPEDGRFIDINRSFLHLFGYHRDQVVGFTSGELGLWESPKDRSQLLQQLARSPQIRDYECRFLTRNRKALDLLVTVDLIELNKKKILIWILNDVTKDRKSVV